MDVIFNEHSEKGVLKQYPWGTIATNGNLFSKGPFLMIFDDLMKLDHQRS